MHRRVAALRSLLGRVVRADAQQQLKPAAAATRSVVCSARIVGGSGSSAPLALLSARSPAAAAPHLPLLLSQQQQQPVRLNHCSCPTLRDDSDGPPRVRVAYDPADVDLFIAVADAIEDVWPGAVVEGDDGDTAGESGESGNAESAGGGECAVTSTTAAAAAVALPQGGPGAEFTVSLPNGKVAFRARAAPRDAAAVVAAIRAAGGSELLGSGEEQ
jgi:hypothetical protein